MVDKRQDFYYFLTYNPIKNELQCSTLRIYGTKWALAFVCFSFFFFLFFSGYVC